jgi:hypothetical protein
MGKREGEWLGERKLLQISVLVLGVMVIPTKFERAAEKTKMRMITVFETVVPSSCHWFCSDVLFPVGTSLTRTQQTTLRKPGIEQKSPPARTTGNQTYPTLPKNITHSHPLPNL